MRSIIRSLPWLLVALAVGCSPAAGKKSSRKAAEQIQPPTLTASLSPGAEHSAAAPSSTPAAFSTPRVTDTITAQPPVFDVGGELTISFLRELEISASEIRFEERLADGANYQRHVVSYTSEGNRVYGLLTLPFEVPPEAGFKAVVFNHGYIPPAEYRTTERYEAYVNALARNGFVVFKIDFRGHGRSQGQPSGTYFSPAYTIDAITALKSLQRLDYVDPQGIGMWGHSMAGNLVLRAMLIEPDIQAGVIWAGAVYSYVDFVKYGIDDYSYRPPPTPEDPLALDPRRGTREILETYGRPESSDPYWQAVSLTENIAYLAAPIQLHHAEDDPVVISAYSYQLAEALQQAGMPYEFYTYEGGGHNLASPYFDQAMIRTIQFFKDNL